MSSFSAPTSLSSPTDADVTSTAGALLGSLEQALRLTEQLQAAAVSYTRVASLNNLRVTLKVATLADVPTAQLLALSSDGHFVSITATGGAWTGTVQAEGPTAPMIESTGPPEDALDGAGAENWQVAVRNSDHADALASIAPLSAAIVVHLRHRPQPTTCHWIATVADLEACLSDTNWASTLLGLSQTSTTLVVSDGGATELRGKHLTICGPGAVSVPPAPPCGSAPAHNDDRPRMPDPELLADLPKPLNAPTVTAQAWDTVWAAAQSCIRLLVWFHLASSARLDNGTANLRLDGARVVELHLRPDTGQTSASADLALYRWTFATADPGRHEAAVRAATLAIVDPTVDLGTAAAPALRTARSLYELTRRTAVAEALASRRTARESAVASARAAATAARDVASKASDRALLQAAAAIAVVLTNVAKLIGDPTAISLLLLIAAVLAGNLFIARQQDLPSAGEALTFDLSDLDQYREALSAADIDNIRDLKTVSAARKVLATTRRTVTVVYGATIALVLVAGTVIVLLAQPPEQARQSPSVPSTPVSSPASTSMSGPATSSATPPSSPTPASATS